jgi:polyisoprenoid-binding protein YceI
MQKPYLRKFLLFLLALGAPLSYGDWLLDPDAARLEFNLAKKEIVSETNRFRKLSGSVTPAGHALLNISLASVDTGNPIRDQHIGNHLFNTRMYSTATFAADLNLSAITALRQGESLELEFAGELSLHGFTRKMNTSVTVMRLADFSFRVISNEPVTVNVFDFGMSPGFDKLRELGDPSTITPSIEVIFDLLFKSGGTPPAE